MERTATEVKENPVQEPVSKEENGSEETEQEQDKVAESGSYLSQSTAEQLRLGILQNFLPEFQKMQASLGELTENQRILVETIQQENTKFGECQALTEVTDCMEQAKLYYSKLNSIKKDMLQLHEKSAKLKKRALKLQQQKQKEALIKEQEREKEMEKERQLIAKPAKR